MPVEEVASLILSGVASLPTEVFLGTIMAEHSKSLVKRTCGSRAKGSTWFRSWMPDHDPH